MFVAVHADPFHGAFGERNFFCGVAGEIEARDERMLEAGTKRSVGAGESSHLDSPFQKEWRRGSAGDDELFGGDTEREQKQKCANVEGAKAHGDERAGVYYRNRYNK